MAKFQKGHTLSKGKGRPKGIPNKLNQDLKAMILEALEKAGGSKYLREQAESNSSAFLQLVGKVIPRDINANIQGNISIEVVNFANCRKADDTDPV